MGARRVTAAALALSAVLGGWALIPGTGGGPGSSVARAAAPSYRFWTYWHRTGGSWAYSDTGPSGYRPTDGSVDGWRYEVTADGAARAPRTTATFAQICGSTPAMARHARVAIVFDYGTPADARRGQHPPASRGACAVIVPGVTAITALDAVATLRFRSDGIICGFDDYPSSGCVDLVGQPAGAPGPSSPGPSSPSSSSPSRSTSPRPTAHRTTRPTGTATPGVLAKPTRRPVRTPEPSPTAEIRTPTLTPSVPTPSATRRASAPAPRTSAPASPPRTSWSSRATHQATSTSSAQALMSSPGSPSTSTSAGPRPAATATATAVAASAAGLLLTGTSRPATGSVAAATWVGLAVLALVAAAAGVLAVRRRRSRSV